MENFKGHLIKRQMNKSNIIIIAHDFPIIPREHFSRHF